ncbi:MAG TPA: hypothetical protein VGH27_18125 [Streptosporangiaceae bacterium]
MRSCSDEDIDLRARLCVALTEALRGQDPVAVPALRSVLGAIGKAADISAVIEAEIGNRLAAARGYEASGQAGQAQQLRREVSAITTALSDG